jgi:hypothetical protein
MITDFSIVKASSVRFPHTTNANWTFDGMHAPSAAEAFLASRLGLLIGDERPPNFVSNETITAAIAAKINNATSLSNLDFHKNRFMVAADHNIRGLNFFLIFLFLQRTKKISKSLALGCHLQ